MITATAVAILGHNISSSSTVTLTAGSSPTVILSSPSVNETITHRTAIMLNYFTSVADQFWRVTFADGSNPDGYVEVGRVVLGEYLQGVPIEHTRSDSVVSSITKQVFGDVGEERLEVKYKFPRSTNSMKVSIEQMFDEVGKFKPFVFSNFNSSFSIIEPLYAVIGDDITFRHISFSEWSYDLSIVEAG